MHRPTPKIKGFTFLEVLVILTLIALLTVVVVSRIQDRDATRHITSGDVLAAHLRYVQMRSMETSASWGLQYDRTQNEYWMYHQGDPAGTRRPLPGEVDPQVDLDQSSVTISQGDFSLRFDDWGRPLLNNTLLSSDLTLDLAMAGRTNLALVVTAQTGFVQWQP